MKKIALVEDNADNRMLVTALLSDSYDVTEYESGPDALAGFASTRPDLVLLDISLPGMNGTEVLQRLRADSELRPIPVIALTAHAMAGDRETFLSQGFDAYVSKPIIDDSLLFATIQELLGQQLLGHELPGDELPGDELLCARSPGDESLHPADLPADVPRS